MSTSAEIRECQTSRRVEEAADDAVARVLQLPGDDQSMVVYNPEPASPSADAMNLLASWTGTGEHADAAAHEDAN